jgi:hypothetical protein
MNAQNKFGFLKYISKSSGKPQIKLALSRGSQPSLRSYGGPVEKCGWVCVFLPGAARSQSRACPGLLPFALAGLSVCGSRRRAGRDGGQDGATSGIYKL